VWNEEFRDVGGEVGLDIAAASLKMAQGSHGAVATLENDSRSGCCSIATKDLLSARLFGG